MHTAVSAFFYVKINSAENLPENSIWGYEFFALNPDIRFSNRRFSLNGKVANGRECLI